MSNAGKRTVDMSGIQRYHECANNRAYGGRPCGAKARSDAGLRANKYPATVPERKKKKRKIRAKDFELPSSIRVDDEIEISRNPGRAIKRKRKSQPVAGRGARRRAAGRVTTRSMTKKKRKS
tara:strand:+ start:161 stop:526 length:366 start_codon:yes stop_codon:yes gene_type:complete